MPPLPAVLVEPEEVQFPRLRKRERTRRQLTAAAIAVFSARGVADATIQEIAAAADMTPGTFYNHFDTKAGIVEAVGIWLAVTFCRRVVASSRPRPEGAERTSIGCRRYVWLARVSPAWALLILDVATNSPKLLAELGGYVLADLRVGLRQKAVRVVSEAAAFDLISGTVMQAMRTAAFGLAPPRHDSAVAATILRGLGVAADEALEISRRPLPKIPATAP